MPGTSPALEQRSTSYGRGGAGNIQSGKPVPTPDLETPPIKSNVYTTGRGGQGNMAKNDPQNPALARELQDVENLPKRFSQSDSHYGRGGVGNRETMTPNEIANAKAANAIIEREAIASGARKNSLQNDLKGAAEGKPMNASR
ncbi:hypothetical protein MMC26_001247 [Xylographa opegraphella]|nr:hypothetical protein [Xylographa opegraphella]